jgi:multidrug efflux pump subunit AcrB
VADGEGKILTRVRTLLWLVTLASLLAAALVLYFRGAAINTMSLAGFVIAVGVVVDDAILVLENIYRRAEEGEGSTE